MCSTSLQIEPSPERGFYENILCPETSESDKTHEVSSKVVINGKQVLLKGRSIGVTAYNLCREL